MSYRIAHIAPDGWQELLVPELEKLGHTVVTTKDDMDGSEDVALIKSITQMSKLQEIKSRFKDVPTINYNWDVYRWALDNPRKDEYNYGEYKKLCSEDIETWVPSRAVQRSLEEFWGLKSHVMKSYVPTIPYAEPTNGGYALQALRNNPDPHMIWYEKACKELWGLNNKTKWRITWAKMLPEQFYRPLLASAGFLVSPIKEMSTGGLFLMEGAIWKKPILASNSPYMGAVDYFGDSIEYFQWDDYDEFKEKLVGMSDGTIKTDTAKAKALVEGMTPRVMAKEITERLEKIL